MKFLWFLSIQYSLFAITNQYGISITIYLKKYFITNILLFFLAPIEAPSKQLKLHKNVYKPTGFTIQHKLIGRKSVLISFNYTKIDLYDQYLFRIRYHGCDEYGTSIKKMNKTQENSLKINNMIDAAYIACVSLFSNNQHTLSSTGMCVDFTIGKTHLIGGSHSSNGLLAPLLLSVAASILIFITIVNFFTDLKWIEFVVKSIVNKRSDCLVKIEVDNSNLHENNPPSLIITGSNSSSFYNFDNSFREIKIDESFVDFYEDEGALSSVKTLNHLLAEKPWISGSPSVYNKNLSSSKY